MNYSGKTTEEYDADVTYIKRRMDMATERGKKFFIWPHKAVSYVQDELLQHGVIAVQTNAVIGEYYDMKDNDSLESTCETQTVFTDAQKQEERRRAYDGASTEKKAARRAKMNARSRRLGTASSISPSYPHVRNSLRRPLNMRQ